MEPMKQPRAIDISQLSTVKKTVSVVIIQQTRVSEYATYHLLWEPETTIDSKPWDRQDAQVVRKDRVIVRLRFVVGNLAGGWTTPLKNMLVKMGIFPKDRGENKKNIWNHHIVFVGNVFNRHQFFALRIQFAFLVPSNK